MSPPRPAPTPRSPPQPPASWRPPRGGSARPAATSPGGGGGCWRGTRRGAAVAGGRGGPGAAPAPREAPRAPASAVVVHAPPPVRDLVDLWGPVTGLPLMRAVKDQFDPGHRMAPGRFVGGI